MAKKRSAKEIAWLAGLQEELVINEARFSLGDRVRLSALGAVRCPRLAGKIGTVVGRSVYVNSVVVILDGTKSRRTIHSAYLEVLMEHLDGRVHVSS